MVDDRTPGMGLSMPHPDNKLEQDVLRLRDALSALDSACTALTNSMLSKVEASELAAAIAGLQGSIGRGGNAGGPASGDQTGRATPPDTTPTLGKTNSKAGSISGGGDSTMGVGGKSSAGTAAAEPGGGYGAGGGAGRGNGAFYRGANGSGGFIRIEEY